MKKSLPIMMLLSSYAAMSVEPSVISIGPAVTILIAVKNADPKMFTAFR